MEKYIIIKAIKYLLLVLIPIVVAIIKYFIKTNNYFKTERQEIAKNRSGIEIALTSRYDTLVKLNKAVNGYTGHESSVLKDVVKIRKGMSVDELADAESSMENAFEGINALAESYPDLKASVNFLHLQDTIYELENTLQATRRIYNEEVSEYNSAVERFPSCIVAKKCGANLEKYFEIEERKRNDVELTF